MTTTVTELPLHLEPATAVSVLAVSPGSTATAPVIRELDRRRSDGIDVRLLWNQTHDQVMVAVFDAKTGDAFQFEVHARDSLEAFHHPYAHAAFRGIDHRSQTST
ncbi:MAG TPA: hypothetical protein VGV67_01090 [Solirubrobacteraceae bacterium]|nr:hypothetical protein [Solirubrobacteraceae bacterium]